MSYINENRPTRMNRLPTDTEKRHFNHSMDVVINLPPPKRITVNLNGQMMLNEYFETKKITGPFRAVPIHLVEDQQMPYVGHNT